MEILKKLTAAFGPSGYEDEVADIIIEEIKDFVDEVKKDRLGNVCSKKR
jgi:putative aminopeptidase FrvX